MTPRRFVDYEDAVVDYGKYRTPTEARLEAWAEAVAPHVRDVGVAVDLGSGAGAFSSALRPWGARCVVAVEPSTAMLSAAPALHDVFRARGRAGAIPLGGDSAALVWISTAFHHFDDPSTAVRECHRVLANQGRVIIRGFIPGHTKLEWLPLFPGSEKAVARFPDLQAMTDLFSEAGFCLSETCLVEEGSQTYGARAEFAAAMRQADSILTAMSDAEIDAGIAALRERRDEIERFALSCLIFQKN